MTDRTDRPPPLRLDRLPRRADYEHLERMDGMEVECVACGRHAGRVCSRADAPIPGYHPPAIQTDDPKFVEDCDDCGVDLHAPGAVREARGWYADVDTGWRRSVGPFPTRDHLDIWTERTGIAPTRVRCVDYPAARDGGRPAGGFDPLATSGPERQAINRARSLEDGELRARIVAGAGQAGADESSARDLGAMLLVLARRLGAAR